MINKILVALDFSEASSKVLEFAGNMALSNGAKLHLVHVVEPYHPYEIYGYTVSESALLNEYADLAFSRAENYMKEAVEKISAEVSVASKVVHGVLPKDLFQEAEEVGAEAVIVGSKGHGLIDYLLGSTAEKIIRMAKIPTFVVPINND